MGVAGGNRAAGRRVWRPMPTPSPAPPGAPWPDAAPPRRLLGVLFLGTLMAALDIALVAPALPALREAFGVDARAASWVFTAFVLANLGGLPLAAALSDRLGRRAVYLGAVALFAAGSLGVALTEAAPWGWGGLLGWRVVQGLGASGIFPVASAVVGDAFPPETRGRAVGVLGAVFGVAFLVGPIVGGVVLATASWPWLFALNLPLAAAVFALSARALPSARAAAPRPLDVPGIGLLTGSVVLLAVGLNRIDAAAALASLASPRVWPFLLGAAAGVPLLMRAERRAAAPLLRPSLLASRQVRIACALAVGAGLAEATFVFLSAYAVAAFGVTKAGGSYLLLPLVAAVAVGSPVAGRLLDRVGSRRVVVAGAGALAAGLGVVAAGWGLAAHVAGTVVTGLGLSGLLGSSLSYILLNESEASERAVAQGLITVFISVGQLTGGAVIGAVAASAAEAEAGYRAAFAIVAVAVAALALLGTRLHARDAERASVRG